MSSFETVRYRLDGSVAIVSLDRPRELNAFDTRLRRELATALEQANQDKEVRVVVLTGEGKGFCAGHDLSNGTGDHDYISQTIQLEYKPILEAVVEGPKIYIAAVHGAAAGIGGSLMMACDLAVMSEDAYLYNAFLAMGLVPDGGATWYLQRHLGHKRAMEFFLEARKISAEKCLKYGLCNIVVPNGESLIIAMDWAKRLAAGAPIAQRRTKQLLRRAATMSLDNIVDIEAAHQDVCSRSEDVATAIQAFMENRRPTFIGK